MPCQSLPSAGRPTSDPPAPAMLRAAGRTAPAPSRGIDRAQPQQLATGVTGVFVNGVQVPRGGEHTGQHGARPRRRITTTATASSGPNRTTSARHSLASVCTPCDARTR